jgi:hypothetical protein
MSRTSTTIIRRATTKPYILGIPTYPHLLPSLRCLSARHLRAGASLSYLRLTPARWVGYSPASGKPIRRR